EARTAYRRCKCPTLVHWSISSCSVLAWTVSSWGHCLVSARSSTLPSTRANPSAHSSAHIVWSFLFFFSKKPSSEKNEPVNKYTTESDVVPNAARANPTADNCIPAKGPKD